MDCWFLTECKHAGDWSPKFEEKEKDEKWNKEEKEKEAT